MAIDPITAIFDLGKVALERLWPNAEMRAVEMRKLQELKQKGNLAELDAHVKLLLGQLEINKEEAKHKSLFVAGWRPAVGWVCVSILAFNYIGIYTLEFIMGLIDAKLEPPSRMDMHELWPVLMGLLGIGGMRSFDKSKGIQTDSIT